MDRNSALVMVFFLFFCSELTAQAPADSLPAFPGAQGFGCYTPGGRGGRVIKVTNLNTSGPGSFQAACSESGPRIVVFDTSGVIPGPVNIAHGRVTIAGQTAPGAGITVKGKFSAASGREYLEDIVVRFVRVRPAPSTDGDGSSDDAVQFNQVRRCVLDHLSCSWSTDENIGMYMSQESTVQWCTVEESDVVGHYKGRHNYGMLSGPEGGRVSVHHNLFANNGRRNPAIANGPSDIRNNVVYNFRDGFLHDNPPNMNGFNLVGNYYRRGPSENDIFPFCFRDWVFYYLRDNYVDGVGVVDNPWEHENEFRGFQVYMHHGVRSEREFATPPVTTHSCLEAYELVLEKAGCLPRDTVSRRTINEVKTRTGAWGRHDPGDLMAGLSAKPAPKDSDSDGMPDAWEEQNGLNPGNSSDNNKVMKSGYTAIEEYCNLLAEKIITTEGRPD